MASGNLNFSMKPSQVTSLPHWNFSSLKLGDRCLIGPGIGDSFCRNTHGNNVWLPRTNLKTGSGVLRGQKLIPVKIHKAHLRRRKPPHTFSWLGYLEQAPDPLPSACFRWEL